MSFGPARAFFSGTSQFDGLTYFTR